MLSKEDIKKAIELDDAAAEAGGYVEPMHELPVTIGAKVKNRDPQHSLTVPRKNQRAENGT